MSESSSARLAPVRGVRTCLRVFLPCLLLVPLSPANAQDADAHDPAEAAETLGWEIGGRALARHYEFTDSKTFSDKNGILVAEGDSWFDYPRRETLDWLRWRFDYRVVSVARHGDTLEEMVYGPDQLQDLVSALQVLRDSDLKPRAVLLSAGGNDIAGPELAMLMNHRESGTEILDEVVADALLRRLHSALITLISAITVTCEEFFDEPIPILVHGYDYPVPDGRGFGWFKGWGPFPGPWLKPAFVQKGFWYEGADPETELDESRGIMRNIIDHFNEVVAAVADRSPHVFYVRILGKLDDSLDSYKDDWANELHPRRQAYLQVAKEFHQVLQDNASP